ncbi:MAG: hypothetical protein HYY50_04385 [Candidatus Kerfeldbacteria bacterium]|nr:hypothetical protein [Candidatus Kerfeldbacteria bacterium]
MFQPVPTIREKIKLRLVVPILLITLGIFGSAAAGYVAWLQFRTSPTLRNSEEGLRQQNVALLAAYTQWNVSSGASRAEAEKQLQQAAERRRAVFRSLVRTKPQDALRGLLTAAQEQKLAQSLGTRIDQRTSMTGTWAFRHWDDTARHTSGRRQYIVADNKNVRVVGDDAVLQAIKPAESVTVEGFLVDDRFLAVSIDETQSVTIQPQAATSRKLAVIMGRFSDMLEQSWTPAQVNAFVLTGPASVASQFGESSYARLELSGDVFGWFPLNLNATCNEHTVELAAIAAADASIDYGAYTDVLVLAPHTLSCGYTGNSSFVPQPFQTQDGDVSLTVAYVVTTQAMQTGNYTMIHELSHNLGLDHAWAWECHTEIYAPFGCLKKFEPYSPFAGYFHHTGPHKRRLGWLQNDRVQTITQSGTYHIEPLETASSGVKLLRVPVGANTHEYLYLEFRQPIGFDNDAFGFLRNYGGATGPLIHHEVRNQFAPPDDSSYLLDFTPNLLWNGQPSIGPNDYSDLYNAPLPAGQSRTFGLATLRTVAVSPEGTDIEIQFSGTPCVEQAPTAIFQPASAGLDRSTGQTSVSVQMLVTNHDTGACPASSVVVQPDPALTAGWTVRSNATQLSIAAGQTDAVWYTLTPKEGSPEGSAAYSFTAQNTFDPALTSSANLRLTYRSAAPGKQTIEE